MVAGHVESKERTLEMCRMRIEGKTFREIGEAFGVSKQRVEQILAKVLYKRGKRGHCVFPKVADWMDEHDHTIVSFAKLLDMKYYTVLSYVRGRYRPSLEFVSTVVKKCGLSWEDVICKDAE